MPSAISELTNIYDERPIRARNGRPLIGVTSNTVPWELVGAAGFQPILLSPHRTATPLADRYMEDIFSPRIRAIFDFLLSPEAEVLSAVIIPRTSEQEHKLYLYLREVTRQGVERCPQPILYNLLHSRTAEAQVYSLERTRALKIQLEQLAGRPIEPEELNAAIEESNAARQIIRSLLKRREGNTPTLSGLDVLPLIGAWYFMDRAEYARESRQALNELDTRAPRKGPRILIKGVPNDSIDFCAAVESHGAVVVAEDDWWGSRAAGRDVEITGDPLQAIFEKYYFDAPSPRVFPAAISDHWFCSKVCDVDGIIFYLPAEDDVLGWDYPRLRAFLDERKIPNLLLRTVPHEEISAFVERLTHG